MERSTAGIRFSPDDVGELISLASRLDDLAERDELTVEQVHEIAAELGISRNAVDRAILTRRRQRRSGERTAVKRVRARMRFIRHATVYVLVIAALVVVDVLGGDGWWFFYVAAIWGVILALHALRFVTRRRGPLERRLLRRELAED